ncbi:hypothetical protein FQN54_009182 [Arachnomyces sp. PD_36]|nr:hypothetical protein FQN54_009182 [Arachnomyces sp. PD_36]
MESKGSEDVLKPKAGIWQWRNWSTRKKILLASLILLLIVALVVGLAVGLSLRGGDEDENNDDGDSGEGQTPDGNETTIWQPSVGTSWQIQLLSPIKGSTVDAEIYDIDLFDNDADVISDLHDEGRKVICYFSAGSYENWRDDEAKFKVSDMGSPLDGWPGERWLDTSSQNVRNIMKSRLQLAKDKGCDGVDPDNVDGYDNENGISLTKADSADYMKFLANATHELNMSIGLKNAGGIIPQVISQMQWSVNEQCVQFNECDVYSAFIRAGKPVFHLEYPKQEVNNNTRVSTAAVDTACDNAATKKFSTLIKNMNLDNWSQACPSD